MLILPLIAAAGLSAAPMKDLSEVQEELRTIITAEPGEYALRVLSYNIQGLPMPPETRHEHYAEIGRRLAALRKEGKAPHLVAIQEAFHPRTPELQQAAGYPYVVLGPQLRRGKFLGSGLTVLSEYPIEVAESIEYSDCTGTDCYANKGAQHLRLKVPGLPAPVDFYNTHLNADADGASPPPEETLRVRLLQIAQLAAFIARTRQPGSVLLFPGDFNFRAGAEDFARFASLPGFANALSVCGSTGECKGDEAQTILKESVDHQFYLPSPGGSLTLAPTYAKQTFKEPYNGEFLSDHWGLEVHFRVLW